MQTLLSNQTVLEEIQLPHQSTENDMMMDLCDGQYFKTHPLVSKYNDALQFIVYYDDIEVGSSARVHKLGY